MSEDFTKLDDNELCNRIDYQGAFVELEYRYLWLIRKKAGDLLGGKTSDKEDFIQEGLLGLYYAAKSFNQKKGTSFKNYAAVCIKNRMINELKRSMKQNLYLNGSVSLDEVDFATSTLEEDMELREDFEAVLNQIHISLSEFEQKVLALYLIGSKRSELPSRYGVSIKAYDNALFRIRQKLKSHRF